MSTQLFELIQRINLATFWMNQIIPLFQIAFGAFGNLFNIIVFTRRNLRTNPCAIYFLAISWNVNLLQKSVFVCKLQVIGQYVPSSLMLWFPTLASIDRFLSSSKTRRFRRLSTPSIARRVSLGIGVVFVLLHVHIFVFVESLWTGYELVCTILSYDYFIFFNFFGPIVACVLPLALVFIFGLLIVHNAHNRVVADTDIARNDRLRSSNRQLTTMLIFQVLITILISFPYAGTCMYYAFGLIMTRHRPSILEQVVYNCASNLALLLYTTNATIGFYIYTLTGSNFRLEAKRCLHTGRRWLVEKMGLVRFLRSEPQPTLVNTTSPGTINVITVHTKTENNMYFTKVNIQNK
ncbi:unnamed protein product [Adineta ricciae]|uniref:G-protein coupled receptors family 1 profile domain-containing protein n=1 Tax=Adineta ricciae TaxID=249248 RepID=A0A815IHD2_ADIRI|nr:unnamed protein product [Adineta ricciae]